MKHLIYLLVPLSLFLVTGAQATESCTTTEFGWEAYCAAQPTKAACDFQNHCQWAKNGPTSCNAKVFGWEAYCAAQPSEISCNFQDHCWWAR
mgnify:CR=1 FL=1